MSTFRETVAASFRSLQDGICTALEKADGAQKFRQDKWTRPEGGGGITKILQDGKVIEKGGVNFSEVFGKAPVFLQEQLFQSHKKEVENFYATGLSIVIHPFSPWTPIIHMNVRYFETDHGINWFGGGIDLTPHYINEEDAVFFHRALKEVCDAHHATYYQEFKKWADNYFFIKHRNETRGVGGIFFDQLAAQHHFTIENRFEFVKAVGEAFPKIYVSLIEKNMNKPYGEQEKQWQAIRRGRYVEFNLVYDRGTRFGLETNGRIESILMSLPKNASWIYDYTPVENSNEAKTLSLLKKVVDWANQR
jgi:coproporphyrinogen III oxidase